VSEANLVLKELKNNNIFLTGGAGVGKSYIVNKIIQYYKDEMKKEVIALGSTGISAVNIGGFTIHSFFVFGISNNFDELQVHDKKNKSRITELKKILKATDLIVIDEISMVSSDIMDMISYRLDSLGFRGKLLLVGDFFQLPPVQKFNQPKNLFSDRLYAFESSSWRSFNFRVIKLNKMQRTTDAQFTHILKKVRIGQCDKEVIDYMLQLTQNRIKDKNPTYLFGRNLEVNNMNRAKLSSINAKEHIFVASVEKHQKGIHQKKIDSWKKSLPIDEELVIKEGVPVLFTINKWGQYANGERGVVVKIEEDYIVVQKDSELIKVQKHEFELSDIRSGENGKIENIKLATLSQFPIKLAYAITIHKSQGMSIDNLVCNVDYIFAPSQFYVAISRAINPKNLRLEFSRGNIINYLYKIINVDKRVKEYYINLKKVI